MSLSDEFNIECHFYFYLWFYKNVIFKFILYEHIKYFVFDVAVLLIQKCIINKILILFHKSTFHSKILYYLLHSIIIISIFNVIVLYIDNNIFIHTKIVSFNKCKNIIFYKNKTIVLTTFKFLVIT